MINQDITFSTYINGQWRNIFIHDNTLCMDAFVLKLDYNICGVALGKNMFFLVFTNENSQENISGANLLYNNISAYDYNGNKLYSINDVVPFDETYAYAFIGEPKEDIHYPYCVDTRHEYLTCSTFSCKNYVIDVNQNKLITVLDSR